MQSFLTHIYLLVGWATIDSFGGFDHRKPGPSDVTGWSSHLYFFMPPFPTHSGYHHILSQAFGVVQAS